MRMSEEKYREMIEKMTNAEWMAFLKEKLQEIEIYKKLFGFEIINGLKCEFCGLTYEELGVFPQFSECWSDGCPSCYQIEEDKWQMEMSKND